MKLKIEWQYKTKSGAKTLLTSDYLQIAEALLFYEDILKTGRVHQIELIDEYESTWLLKEVKKYLAELEEEPHDVELYFDASFNREERLAGLGAVVYFKQNGKKYRIRQNYFAELIDSNNDAEYAALHFALRLVEELGVFAQQVTIYGDSQVVIQQMAGEWPVYEKTLQVWADKIDAELTRLKLKPTFIHIPRQQNTEAHNLASQALQGVDIESQIHLDE